MTFQRCSKNMSNKSRQSLIVLSLLSLEYSVLNCSLVISLSFSWLFFIMPSNGYVYETFGVSKRFSVKLQVLLIRAETIDNLLTAKCFIYDVVVRALFICLSKPIQWI